MHIGHDGKNYMQHEHSTRREKKKKKDTESETTRPADIHINDHKGFLPTNSKLYLTTAYK